MEDVSGEDPYARIVQKILALCIAGGGVVAAVVGGFQAGATSMYGVALQVVGFAALMIASHLWLGKHATYITGPYDLTCAAFICFALDEWIGLWAYALLAVVLVVILAWSRRSLGKIDQTFAANDNEE